MKHYRVTLYVRYLGMDGCTAESAQEQRGEEHNGCCTAYEVRLEAETRGEAIKAAALHFRLDHPEARPDDAFVDDPRCTLINIEEGDNA